MPKVGFFPGSTLGNFEPHEACAFLRSAREILGQDAQMVIGVDLEKDERVLYEAYNDKAGVTARFNLNVLHRINRELGGNFDLSAFTHRAIYNRERHRIEMHLISRKAQTVRVLGRSFSFRAGESIHTENSYKYSLERFAALARGYRLDAARILDGCGFDVLGSRAGGLGLRLFGSRLVGSGLGRVRSQRNRFPHRDHDHDRGCQERQHQRRQPACEPGEDRERDDADAMGELKKAPDGVLEQDGADQKQQAARRSRSAPSSDRNGRPDGSAPVRRRPPRE